MDTADAIFLLLRNTTLDINSTEESPKNTKSADQSHAVWLGIFLALCGNLFNSFSFNTQKYAHMQIEKLQEEQGGKKSHYLKNPCWWGGIVLMSIGEVINFSALAFAPASVVVPLGTTTILGNMIIARIWLREKPRFDDIFGTILAIGGSFILVWFSNKKDHQVDAESLMSSMRQPGFILYVCLLLLLLLVLLVCRFRFNQQHIIVSLLITNVFASFSVMSAKAVAGMLRLTIEGTMQLQYAIFWILLVVMLFTAIIQIRFLQEAIAKYNATMVMPISFVFFTIGAIMIGAILYKEFESMHWAKVLLFLLGCSLSFIGVFFIASKSAEDEHYGYIDCCIQWLKTRPRKKSVKKWPTEQDNIAFDRTDLVYYSGAHPAYEVAFSNNV